MTESSLQDSRREIHWLSQLHWRCLWVIVLLAHLAVLCGWWWLSPKGFPVSHSRFWVNSVFPWIGLFAILCGLRFILSPTRLQDLGLASILGLWAGAGIAAGLLFPASILRILFLITPVVLALAALAWVSLERTRKEAVALLVGMLLGAGLMFSQQAPISSTYPMDIGFEFAPPAEQNGVSSFKKGAVSFNAEWGQLSLKANKSTLEVYPLLGFGSRSPDRCWTIFASSRHRKGPSRKLLGTQTKEKVWSAFYQSDFSSILSVNVKYPKLVTLESTSHLTKPIYSHLNGYCSITLTETYSKPVSILFSPCPDTPIEVKPADYPIGQPVHSAFLNEDGFHVVQATKKEKGPFTKLASGPLTRGEPVSLTFVVDGSPIFRVKLNDWSRQASIDLSPTAGWGFPMNSITLWPRRDGCYVSIALAETSIGRGWDSVGHKEGTYRERMQVELLE